MQPRVPSQPRKHASHESLASNIEGILETNRTLRESAEVCLQSVKAFGLPHAVTAQEPFEFKPTTSVASFASLYHLPQNLWIDVFLEAKPLDALKAFQSLTQNSSIVDPLAAYDFLGEILNITRAQFRHSFTEDGEESFIHSVPRPVPQGNLVTIHNLKVAKLQHHILSDSLPFLVTILVEPILPKKSTLGQLRPANLTLEPIPVGEGSHLNVLNRGVTLTPAWIEKLRNRFMHTDTIHEIEVVTPPSYHSLLYASL